ncbi:Putative NAD(P)H nitroreductase YdjA [bacterium HR39]|nr:Putative NAD(P)H nitroreductase YdjA [bacterium HR39]
MDAIEAILTRRTVPIPKLGEPGPDDATLDLWLRCAAAAPDHGRLVPFRFLVVRGEGRGRLGELFARAHAEERPDEGEAQREKLRTNPTRVPLVLIAWADVRPDHPKIPEIEQIEATAAAVENLLIAVHASGFAAKWATGFPAYSPAVRRGLGLPETGRIVAILYIGTPISDQPIPPRPAPGGIARPWP